MKKSVTALLLVAAFAVTLIGCAAAPEAKTNTQEGIYLNQKLDSPSVSVLTDTAVMLTREEAKALAFAHAGVTDAFDVEIELDNDKGIVHYEVDFDTAEAEFDYEVDAYTGEILKSRKVERKTAVTPAPEAPAPVTPAPEAPATGEKLTREQAKELALKHAGVADVYDLEVELDKDKGVLHYDVEFETNQAEYDYELDAYTGEILKSRVKEKKVSVPEGERLTKEAAKQIALKHAGENPSRVEVELDRDNGVYKYEIEFRVGAYEYEYEVEAYTGEILKSQKEWDD